MKTKIGLEPAFPLPTGVEVNYNELGVIEDPANGMSKRFYAACAIMQGLLANESAEITVKDAKDYAEISYNFADELLRQENL